MKELAPLLACLALSTPALAQQLRPVFTVSTIGGLPADFDQLQIAIDTVPDGAVLLLSGGSHGDAVISAKGLHLITDVEGPEEAVLFAEIDGQTASQTVVIRGLRELQSSVSGRPRLNVTDSDGQVWVEASEIFGRSGISLPTIDGSRIENSRGVQFVRTLVDGGRGFFGEPGTGMVVLPGARVALHECELTGQSNLDYYCGGTTPGLAVEAGAQVRAADSKLVGGSCYIEFAGSTVAPAARLGDGALLSLRSVDLQPGSTPDLTAPEIDAAPTATVIEATQALRGVVGDAVIGSGAMTPLSLYGAPGDLAWIGVSGTPQLFFDDALFSVLSLAGPQPIAGPLALGGSGTLDLMALAPSVPPGFALPFFLQGYYLPANPTEGLTALLGTPSAVVISSVTF